MTCRVPNCAGRLIMMLTYFVPISDASAIELRSYEFLPHQGRLFSYGGGLLGIDVAAQLAGSFDVEIEADGTARIARFEVQLIDILDTSLFDAIGWNEGDSLADRLFVNPVGLVGQRSGNRIGIGPIPVEPSWTDMAATNVYIEELGGGIASVRISSQPEFIIDSPSMRTESPGFAVRVVPEPSTTMLLGGALAGAVIWSRRRSV